MNKSPKIYLNKFRKILIFLILISSIFLSTILISKRTFFNLNYLSYKERQGLNNFFEYLLLRESGIYVLFGTKPIIFSNTCIISNEKYKKHYKKIPENIKKYAYSKKGKLNFYLKDWEKVQKYFKIKEKYMLFFKKYEDIGIADVYFVNKTNLISVLTEYYSIFKERTKIDFNPLTIVNEFNNDNSKFWNVVRKDMLLQGLIFGYGIVNSSLFDRWLELNETENRDFVDFGFEATDKHLLDQNIKVNYKKFPLPVFRSFPNDSILDKYKIERKKIIALYRGRNALEVTLKELCE